MGLGKAVESGHSPAAVEGDEILLILPLFFKKEWEGAGE